VLIWPLNVQIATMNESPPYDQYYYHDALFFRDAPTPEQSMLVSQPNVGGPNPAIYEYRSWPTVFSVKLSAVAISHFPQESKYTAFRVGTAEIHMCNRTICPVLFRIYTIPWLLATAAGATCNRPSNDTSFFTIVVYTPSLRKLPFTMDRKYGPEIPIVPAVPTSSLEIGGYT
jgi:hypothetical protein